MGVRVGMKKMEDAGDGTSGRAGGLRGY